MQWSPQQDAALTQFGRWFSGNPHGEVFRLFGAAGTGKTSLAKELRQMISGTVLYGAYTGKAALVMRSKGCEGASTVHSLLYKVKDKSKKKIMDLEALIKETEDPEKLRILQKRLGEEQAEHSKPGFSLNEFSPIRDADLVIIDECSMIDQQVGHDLAYFKTPILALGDPFQLPPVKGVGYFDQNDPDVLLTEVHRTALESPVLQLATRVREGGDLSPGQYGDSLVTSARDCPRDRNGLSHDQVLVGKNKTRISGNINMRAQLGRKGVMPTAEDRIVCLRNNHEAGLLNGMLFTVVSAIDDGDSLEMVIRPDDGGIDRTVIAHREIFLGQPVPFYGRRDREEFDFGYALTAHKAQGSEWKSVFVVDESASFRADRYKWLYTAITRASERVTIIK